MKTGARKKCGFSLVEVMIATGILTIGFAFIAGVFPVGIKLVASATETTMAPIIEQEAFAKIRLYGVDFSSANWPGGGITSGIEQRASIAYDQVSPAFADPAEYDYPSAITVDDKNYSWSAICRYVGSPNVTDVQVTVFVSRKAGSGAKYWYRDDLAEPLTQTPRPMPVKISVTILDAQTFRINATAPSNLENDFVVSGSVLVIDGSGNRYTVLSRNVVGTTEVQVEVDKDLSMWINWEGPVWVVPPAVGGSRNPCIGVYQKTITF